jgi:hypothetical protein
MRISNEHLPPSSGRNPQLNGVKSYKGTLSDTRMNKLKIIIYPESYAHLCIPESRTLIYFTPGRISAVHNVCTLYKSLNKSLFDNIYDISYIDEDQTRSCYGVSIVNTRKTLGTPCWYQLSSCQEVATAMSMRCNSEIRNSGILTCLSHCAQFDNTRNASGSDHEWLEIAYLQEPTCTIVRRRKAARHEASDWLSRDNAFTKTRRRCNSAEWPGIEIGEGSNKSACNNETSVSVRLLQICCMCTEMGACTAINVQILLSINFSSQSQLFFFFFFFFFFLLLLLLYSYMFRPTSGHHQAHNTKSQSTFLLETCSHILLLLLLLLLLFTSVILQATDLACPRGSTRNSRFPHWFSHTLIHYIGKNNYLYPRYKKSKNSYYNRFSHYRKLLKITVSSDRLNWRSSTGGGLKTPPTTFWKYVSSFRQHNSHAIHLDTNSTNVVESTGVAEVFA